MEQKHLKCLKHFFETIGIFHIKSFRSTSFYPSFFSEFEWSRASCWIIKLESRAGWISFWFKRSICNEVWVIIYLLLKVTENLHWILCIFIFISHNFSSICKFINSLEIWNKVIILLVIHQNLCLTSSRTL